MKPAKIFFIFIVLTISSCGYLKQSNEPDISVVESASTDPLTPKQDPKESNKEVAKEYAKEYVLGSDDIPLFSGLNLIEEDSSSFDTTLGSIIVSKYSGDSKLNLVKDFYLQTLPQLGWKLLENKSDKITFSRDKDKLEIRLNYDKKLYIRFFISSAVQ